LNSIDVALRIPKKCHMEIKPYRFRDVHPEAYHTFTNAGWSKVVYGKADNGDTIIKAMAPDGQLTLIELPRGNRPGLSISDVDMLKIFSDHNISVIPLSVSEFVIGYADAWCFHQSEKKDWLMEKKQADKAESILYLNTAASRTADTLFFVEDNGIRTEAVTVGEVNSLYEVGAYLTEKGWLHT